jgi:hypothetical protein
MKKEGKPVIIICCDNSGENTALKQAVKQSPFYVKFELTAPSSPQQNGSVERKSSILYDYMRSM